MTLSAHFETDAQQRHKSEAVALGSEYYAHFFFFKHLPYLEDNGKLSKAFNLTKGAILKSYYHDTLVPITHQNKNKQVNKSFK